MNEELQEVVEYFVDNYNCKAEMWKDSKDLYHLMFECLDEIGYTIIISETEETEHSWILDKDVTRYYGECWTDFCEQNKFRIINFSLMAMVKDIVTFIDKQKEEYRKTQHDLTGRYGLISTVYYDGRKEVVCTIPEFTDDQITLENKTIDLLWKARLGDTSKTFTYDIVDLGVGKHEK